MMLLDFSPQVRAFAAQPFWLLWPSGRRVRRHAPDIFVRLAGGGGMVVDVRADDRIGPEDAEAFEATAAACESVRSVSFLADGRLLASKGRDGSVRLWDCGAWTPAGVIAEPGKGAWSPRLALHPGRAVLATAGSDEGVDDAVVHLWHLDPDRLLGQSRPPSVTYTSAKIVLVGESGVGKTGLGYRLAHGTEEASTPCEIQSVRRPPAATTPLCVTTSDHAGPRPRRVHTRSN
jgi:hypothetical protein